MKLQDYFKEAEKIVSSKGLTLRDTNGGMGFDKMTDLVINFVVFSVIAVVGVVLIAKFGETDVVIGDNPNISTNASTFLNELEGVYLQIPDFAEILLFAIIGAIVIGAVLMYRKVSGE